MRNGVSAYQRDVGVIMATKHMLAIAVARESKADDIGEALDELKALSVTSEARPIARALPARRDSFIRKWPVAFSYHVKSCVRHHQCR